MDRGDDLDDLLQSQASICTQLCDVLTRMVKSKTPKLLAKHKRLTKEFDRVNDRLEEAVDKK